MRLGLLRPRSVSVYSSPDAAQIREFISPNGFAEYYGAPQGKKLTGPNLTIRPQPVEISMESVAAAAAQHQGWKLVAVLLAGRALLFILKRFR